MARQTGILPLTGTIGGITFYRMQGAYYARSKSSLDKKRIYRDKAFTRTLQNARWFGKAVEIAREVYRQHFERSNKNRLKVWYPMRNRAQELVRGDVSEAEVKRILVLEFVHLGIQKQTGETAAGTDRRNTNRQEKQKQSEETGSGQDTVQTPQAVKLSHKNITPDQLKQVWEELQAYKTLLDKFISSTGMVLPPPGLPTKKPLSALTLHTP